VSINLLDNAIKYSHAESRLSIVGHMTPGQIEVRASNEGKGFPQEELLKVFEQFYRTLPNERAAHTADTSYRTGVGDL